MSASITQNAENSRQTEQMAVKGAQDAEESGRTVDARPSTAMKHDRREDLDHRGDRLPDEPAGAERGHRGGARRRARQGLRGGGDRGAEAGRAQPDRGQGDQRSGRVERQGGRALRAAARASWCPAIRKTAELVQEVAAASREQASGVGADQQGHEPGRPGDPAQRLGRGGAGLDGRGDGLAGRGAAAARWPSSACDEPRRSGPAARPRSRAAPRRLGARAAAAPAQRPRRAPAAVARRVAPCTRPATTTRDFKRVLRRRPWPDQATRPSRRQYLTFFVADEEYAIGILRVREILAVRHGHQGADARRPCIRGVINLRGSVVPVVDLAVKFGLRRERRSPSGPASSSSRWTLDGRAHRDGGAGRRRAARSSTCRPSDIEPPPAFGTRVRVDYLRGMGKVGQEVRPAPRHRPGARPTASSSARAPRAPRPARPAPERRAARRSARGATRMARPRAALRLGRSRPRHGPGVRALPGPDPCARPASTSRRAKKALLVGRLGRRLRELGLHSLRRLLRAVTGRRRRASCVRMLDCICTNETHFFREPRALRRSSSEQVFPDWRAPARGGPRPRACASGAPPAPPGEEPYSLAMSLLARFPPEAGWDVEILATDLSTRVLEPAARGGLAASPEASEIPLRLPASASCCAARARRPGG